MTVIVTDGVTGFLLKWLKRDRGTARDAARATKVLIQRFGVSRRALAVEIGVTPEGISMWLTGKCTWIEWATLEAIAKAFALQPWDLRIPLRAHGCYTPTTKEGQWHLAKWRRRQTVVVANRIKRGDNPREALRPVARGSGRVVTSRIA